jgi:hypothetical protein
MLAREVSKLEQMTSALVLAFICSNWPTSYLHNQLLKSEPGLGSEAFIYCEA